MLPIHLVEGVSYCSNIARPHGGPGFEQKSIRRLVDAAPTLGAQCARLSIGCGLAGRVRMAWGGWIVREHSGHGKGFGVAKALSKRDWTAIYGFAPWPRGEGPDAVCRVCGIHQFTDV